MRRSIWLLLWILVVAACGPAPSAPAPTGTGESPSPPPPAVAPTRAAPSPAPTSPPAAAPTSPSGVQPPTPQPTRGLPPTGDRRDEGAAPAAGAALAPLDVAAQAAALRPEFRSDLDRAAEWNRYTIRAAIDTDARTLAGRLQLEYTNHDRVTLDRVYFHLYPNLKDLAGRLDIRAAAVDGQPVPLAYESARSLLRIDLPSALPPGAAAVIALDFATRAPENASRDFYGAFNKENGILSLASALPIAAIVRGGAWDIAPIDTKGDLVNSETALYDVTLSAPADWTLITTGVAVESRRDGGQQTVRFVSGPQRDFMISAAQYRLASSDVDGIRVNSWYRPGSEAGGQAALQAAAAALRAFNKRYGPYPLRELDVVEIDARTFLGVEYPGLIMIEHRLYGQPDALAVTVAHEVGHQWWYSQVGNDVQTEAWLDEALASYSQVVYREETAGPEAAERELDGFRQRYAAIVAAGADAPVAQRTADFSNRSYFVLVYGKAVLFVQALRERIGEAAFDRFLHDYYAQHRYGIATGADLLASANAACGCRVDDLYDVWINKAVPVQVP